MPLCGDEGGALSQYEEWLENNELELALDELEMLGEVNRVDCAFWQHLLYAALEMDLTAHAARYRQRLSF